MYFAVIAVMRCMGKRQVGQLQPYELVIALMISDLAALPMQDTGLPLLSGIIPILSLLLAQVTISILVLKSRKARDILCGKSRILVKNGQIQETNLRNEMYTIDDLMEALRLKGYPNVTNVNLARLENNGELSIVPFSKAETVQRQDMNLTVPESILADIIIDGHLIEENLSTMQVSASDLTQAIRNAGGKSVQDVLYCNVDTQKQFTIQLRRYAVHNNQTGGASA